MASKCARGNTTMAISSPIHFADTVYPFSSKSFVNSTDGGKTYKPVETRDGDYHDLWIDLHDHLRLIDGDDGAGDVGFDAARVGARRWFKPPPSSTP